MKIGFDGKRAFQNRTGLGNYSRSLISILAQHYPQHHYTLFAPKQTDLFNVNAFPNTRIITPKSFWGKRFPTLWRNKLVTKAIAESGANIFHGISNELPKGIEECSVKKIVTIHDIIYERYPDTYNFDERFIHRKKIKRSCKVADTIIAISDQTKKDLIEIYKIPEKKIVVCHQSCNPIFEQQVSDDQKRFIKERYDLPDKYFLFVSSITKRKNLISLCKAMVSLKDKLDIPLVIIGSGKLEKKEAKKFMQENDLLYRLIFLNDLPQGSEFPFTSGADFPAIYQQALALVYPSIYEGFGLPILEALWSGLPVISSNTSSMPEAGGDAALYFSPLDHKTLAAHMFSVATNTDVRNDMRNKGYAHAQNFAINKYADKMISIYEKTL
ncbi:MAG: glycosyltransferase family 1 protein [Bacteroidota bacterium]